MLPLYIVLLQGTKGQAARVRLDRKNKNKSVCVCLVEDKRLASIRYQNLMVYKGQTQCVMEYRDKASSMYP